MLVRPSEEDAQGQLEVWFIAPSGNYRDTLSWLAVLSESDYPLYLDQVATTAEVPRESLDKEVVQRRRLLDGTYPTPGALIGAGFGQPAHAQAPGRPAPAPQWAPTAQPPSAYPMARAPQGPMAHYQCHHCGANRPPIVRSRVTTSGWVFFAVLLMLCFITSFLPLITMREQYQVCGSCRRQLT